jgi:hypothetical protein
MINLSTPSQQMLDELNVDLERIEYWQQRWHSGADWIAASQRNRARWNKERKPFIASEHEYKSVNGNRWYCFDIPFWPEGFDDLQMLSASFIYYETYASIGAFIPKYVMNEQTNMMDDACVIYTSHFFERYCERMKIPFRSRQMVLEFASIIAFNPLKDDTDKDGRPIVVSRMPKAGYTYGVRRKDNPNIIEMRTFLSDKNMTPTKLRRYEELRERVDDDSFIAESYNLSVWGSIYQKNNIAIPKE